jgi:formylglycine-generating enzyme required for sulfatase activity
MTFPPPLPSFLLRRTYIINGHTFHTVLVEKGSFGMGDDEYGGYILKPVPAHTVTVATDFELCEYPVTQALWAAVMGEEWPETRFKGPDRPVEMVSWDDAQHFFEVLNGCYAGSEAYRDRPGRFCLPTEAQWEYAARGGRYGKYFNYVYSGGKRLEELGWYWENSHGETQPVGRKLPNALGLYDMSGNVLEWCEDDWHGNYESAPDDGSAWVDTPRGSSRVCRGGSWGYGADDCRVAYRYDRHPGSRGSRLGFRAAFVPQSGG